MNRLAENVCSRYECINLLLTAAVPFQVPVMHVLRPKRGRVEWVRKVQVLERRPTWKLVRSLWGRLAFSCLWPDGSAHSVGCSPPYLYTLCTVCTVRTMYSMYSAVGFSIFDHFHINQSIYTRKIWIWNSYLPPSTSRGGRERGNRQPGRAGWSRPTGSTCGWPPHPPPLLVPPQGEAAHALQEES